MPDYGHGIIYLITDNTNDNKYIGSTTYKLATRIRGHESNYRDYVAGKRIRRVMSFDIIKNGDYKYEVLEYYPCESRRELEKREQDWLDKIDCINIKRAFATREDRLQMNRVYDKKRTRDHIPYLKNYRDYRKSWGGDSRNQNNLLLIQLECFM